MSLITEALQAASVHPWWTALAMVILWLVVFWLLRR